MRTILAIALLGLAVVAGCTAPAPDGATGTTVETPTDTATTPATTATETTPATTETDSEPRTGDQLLSATEISEAEAAEWNASRRADFADLSTERRAVVREAVDCDCNVALDGEFSFYDKERVAVVSYDGQHYYLRVAIV